MNILSPCHQFWPAQNYSYWFVVSNVIIIFIVRVQIVYFRYHVFFALFKYRTNETEKKTAVESSPNPRVHILTACKHSSSIIIVIILFWAFRCCNKRESRGLFYHILSTSRRNEVLTKYFKSSRVQWAPFI